MFTAVRESKTQNWDGYSLSELDANDILQKPVLEAYEKSCPASWTKLKAWWISEVDKSNFDANWTVYCIQA